MHFWVFFISQSTELGVFGGGVLKFQIFLGVLKFLFFLWVWGGERKMLGPSIRMKKNESIPPPPCDCRMTTTKSCRFVGGRDASVALPV